MVAPLSKALERLLHDVVAPRLPNSIAKWPKRRKPSMDA
jgi:hypothetical protein